MTDKNSSGKTVMMAAAQGGFIDAMKFVLANGGSFAEVDNDGPHCNDGSCSRTLRRGNEVHPCQRRQYERPEEKWRDRHDGGCLWKLRRSHEVRVGKWLAT